MEKKQHLRAFQERYGEFGGRETRVLSNVVDEIAESRAGGKQFTVRGHAAVFDRWSLDLGGFREKIAKGAFDKVLGGNPDVHLLQDHDTGRVLARTKNKTLELRVDPVGLHYWGRVAPTSYAADLRVLLERGDIDQASFAFRIAPGGQEWKIIEDDDGDETVERTITEIGELYDVTITAQGAYPQTDSSVARSAALAYARDLEFLAEKRDTEDEDLSATADDENEPPDSPEAGERDDAADDSPADDATDEPTDTGDDVDAESEGNDDAPEGEADDSQAEEPSPHERVLAYRSTYRKLSREASLL